MVGTLALALAPGAAADTIIAPPGNPGVKQYRETIPSSSGDRTTGTKPAVKSHSAPVLAPATVRTLDRQGRDGRAAAQALSSSSSDRASRKDKGTVDPPVPAGGSTPVGTVFKAAATGDGGGIGLLLPILLGSALLAAVAFLIRRWRAD